jgi:hypothetical protein
MMAPKNADGFGPSQVLYAETYEAEAVAVAEAFGIAPASVVDPLDPASPPTREDFEGAHVIVIIGEDGVIDPTSPAPAERSSPPSTSSGGRRPLVSSARRHGGRPSGPAGHRPSCRWPIAVRGR